MYNLHLFISGKAHSGKDTLLNVIQTFQPLKVHHTAFANEVKREYCRLNSDVDFDRLMHDNKYKSLHRKGLVEIGDGYRKKFSSSIWIEHHKKFVDGCIASSKFEIFGTTDTRYSNELFYANVRSKELARMGDIVLTIRINASLPTRLSRMEDWDSMVKYLEFGQHNESETSLDGMDCGFDLVIDNEENVSEQDILLNLKKKVEPILDICHALKTKRESYILNNRP